MTIDVGKYVFSFPHSSICKNRKQEKTDGVSKIVPGMYSPLPLFHQGDHRCSYRAGALLQVELKNITIRRERQQINKSRQLCNSKPELKNDQRPLCCRTSQFNKKNLTEQNMNREKSKQRSETCATSTTAPAHTPLLPLLTFKKLISVSIYKVYSF